MKLPFNNILGPVLKPNFTYTRLFCKNPTFIISIPYTYLYSIIGLFVNIHHLKKHLGETPYAAGDDNISDRNEMLVHDLKIIQTSMGLIQYTCLLVGCFTENPSLFLLHLAGQLVIIGVRLFNAFLVLVSMNLKTLMQLRHKLTAIALMTFNWLQEFCAFRQYLCLNRGNSEDTEGIRVKLRALLVGLLGVSMSACAFASQPVELAIEDEDVAQRLSNVSFARRITKPTIRLVMGCSKLSAFVTGATSLLLLIAVMSKQSWWQRGARWLAAPALLVAALETASDASDALLAAILRGPSEPARVAAQTAAACLLITVEILVWYFIAKFFEYNPPPLSPDAKTDSLI